MPSNWLDYVPLVALVLSLIGVPFRLMQSWYEKQIDRITADRDKWQSLALRSLQAGERLAEGDPPGAPRHHRKEIGA